MREGERETREMWSLRRASRSSSVEVAWEAGWWLLSKKSRGSHMRGEAQAGQVGGVSDVCPALGGCDLS